MYPTIPKARNRPDKRQIPLSLCQRSNVDTHAPSPTAIMPVKTPNPKIVSARPITKNPPNRYTRELIVSERSWTELRCSIETRRMEIWADEPTDVELEYVYSLWLRVAVLAPLSLLCDPQELTVQNL